MLNLLTTFSIQQILVYTVMLAFAIKGVVDFTFWCKSKYKERFNKDYSQLTKQQELEQHYETCREQHKESVKAYGELDRKIDSLSDNIDKKFGEVEKSINILSSSSKNDIKAWIVKTYHESKEKNYLDDFTRDIIERRFEDYKELGGNSYIARLVEEMRNLPSKN